LYIDPAELNYTNQYGRLVSCAIAAPGLTIEAFLAAARGHERFLWRTENHIFAGSGIAAELSAWGQSRFQAMEREAAAIFREWVHPVETPELAYPRLFGGFAFQDDFVPDNTWSIYAPAMFILPHYQFAQEHGHDPWLILNVLVPFGDDAEAMFDDLRAALEHRAALLHETVVETKTAQSAPVQVNYPMPFPIWQAGIERATQSIRAGKLAKVVLARAFELRFAERVNVDRALGFLAEHYAECYRFLFEPRPHHAFYGATPELLIHTAGAQIRTMGLAGSIRRGRSVEEDQALAESLLSDPKERLEHQLVVEALREKLTPLTTTLNIPKTPQFLRLSNIQHLYTPISGVRGEGAAPGVLPLVELLHPTPALGGSPREAAIQFLRETEPVPRGWYAAPIGWIDPNLDGEFGVAIRSAVSEEQRVWLYAGAGIVGSSLPEKEWAETALKFRPMLNALGVTDLQGLL